jgi:hypothetical protein
LIYYIIKYNRLPSLIDKNKDVKILGVWLSKQKQNYKNNEFNMKESIKKLWQEFIKKYDSYL